MKKKEQERASKGILKAKERQALQDKRRFEDKLELKPKKGDFNEDIWQHEGNKK